MKPTLCTLLSYHRLLTLNYRTGPPKPATGAAARPDFIYGARPMSAAVLQFIDETLAGEMLREHEVWLGGAETVQARELLQLRFGDNAASACEAFTRGAFRMQVAGTHIDSLDAHVAVAPGLAVKLIQLGPPVDQ